MNVSGTTKWTLLPKQFRPSTLQHFVGPARDVAVMIDNAADTYLPLGVAAAFLFFGEPGCGKSSLAKYALERFGVTGFNLSKHNGADVTIDVVRELHRDLRNPNVLPGYRGVWFDEVNFMTRPAQGRFLTLSDEWPERTILVATCNAHVDELEPQFQSRFQPFEVRMPVGKDVTGLLATWFQPTQIAELVNVASDGNPTKGIDVRALLNDATTLLIKNNYVPKPSIAA